MSIKYESLKEKYFKLFDNNLDHFNYIITDVLFAYNEISELIENNKIEKVLEVGCGTGILLRELKEKYKHVKFTGLDPNQSGFHRYEKISKNNLKLDNSLEIKKTSIENFNNNDKYNLIFSFNVFEHVENQDKYILKTMSLLKNDGMNVIFAPNYDFPYEPHFLIPIIFNKNITKKIFQRKIQNHEKRTGEEGLWQALQFTGKRKIKRYLKNNNLNFTFERNISQKILNRVTNDKIFSKRQGLAAKLAIIGKKFFLDKLIFDFLKIPFPYFKLIIKKK